MKQQEIIHTLRENHTSFTSYINTLPEKDFLYSNNHKWTAGQQLDHIYLSVKPLNKALLLPKFIIKLIFGKANRPSKSYIELVEKYHNKLLLGGAASGRFVPKDVNVEKKSQLIKEITTLINDLAFKIASYSEQDLDIIILPHPLLGKITLREMLYFTMYHVIHHHELTKKNLTTH